MPTSRKQVYEKWTDKASTDLDASARTHRLARPAALGAVAGDGQWRGAAARVDLSRELFQAPAGWSLNAKEAEGWIGHRYGRLCLLQAPDGQRLLFVVLDALVGSRWLAEALGRRFAPHGVDVARVFLGCTHTHGAAGRTFGDLFYDTMGGGMLPAFDTHGATWMEERLADAVDDLLTRLVPVTLHGGEGVIPHKQIFQRALGPYLAQVDRPDTMTSAEILAASQRAQPPGWEPAAVPGVAQERGSLRAVEPRAPVFVVRDAAGELVYASATVNGTPSLVMVGARVFSSDAFGLAATGLERALTAGGNRPVVALMAGAHGDANISVVEQRVQEVLAARSKKRRSPETLSRIALRYIQTAARSLAQALEPAIVAATPLGAAGVEVRFAEAFAPGASVASRAVDVPVGEVPSPLDPRYLPTEWNFGSGTLEGSEFSKNDADLSALYTLGTRRPIHWLSGHVDPVGWSGIASTLLFLGRPREVLYSPFLPLRIVRLGSLVFVGMPAEPSVRMLDAVKGLFPVDQVVLCGNVGAYTGYADTIGAGLMQEYEGSSSFWGRDFGVFLLQQLEALRDVASFQRASKAPAADEWLLGGPMLGNGAVGGSAWFSLGKRRARTLGQDGPGALQSGRAMRFEADVAIPIGSPLPPAPPVRVVGYWRPVRAAVARRGDDVSWPRPGEHGPVAVIEMPDGSELRSDDYPMLLRWNGDLWHVWAELDDVPVRLRIEGVGGVRPIGADQVDYT